MNEAFIQQIITLAYTMILLFPVLGKNNQISWIPLRFFFFLKCYRSFSPYAHLSLVPRVSLLSVRGSVLHGHSFSLSNARDKTKNIFIYFLYHL